MVLAREVLNRLKGLFAGKPCSYNLVSDTNFAYDTDL